MGGMEKHPHNELIEQAGRKDVAKRFNLTPQSLYNWSTRGIPPLRRIAFAKFCAERGVSMPADFFDKFEDAA